MLASVIAASASDAVAVPCKGTKREGGGYRGGIGGKGKCTKQKAKKEEDDKSAAVRQVQSALEI